MKKRLLILALLLPACLWAQKATTDSAELLVQRYIRMLNYDALPKDSMLVMETTVSYLGSPDTFVMRRWYAYPDMLRVEIWKGDSLNHGFCTNGSDRYREYVSRHGWWEDVFSAEFMRRVKPYDFHCPLYDWNPEEAQLTYAGTTSLKGQVLNAVRVEQSGSHPYHYLFEEQSGMLLFIIAANEESSGQETHMHLNRTDWKAFHEYTPVGTSLIASEESFMRNGILTIQHTKAHFEAVDRMRFNQDTPKR